MVKVYDVPADVFIEKLAQALKQDEKIKAPAWSQFVKTGPHATRMPKDNDWWHDRCASLLRKVYLHGPVRMSDLKSTYGGRKKTGYALAKHKDAGGAIIRKALQQLEAAGYIGKADLRGRIMTKEGMKKMDALAKEIHKELISTMPQLAKYA